MTPKLQGYEAAADFCLTMQDAAAEIFEQYNLDTSRLILASGTELFINEIQKQALPGFRQNMKDMLNHEEVRN